MVPRRQAAQIVDSVLSGAAPWLELSAETSLAYGMFGGHSPFANWTGDDPSNWEHFPTPDSLFLTNELGDAIRQWVTDLSLFLREEDERGLPARPSTVAIDLTRRGLGLCELIREEIPYYYVTPTFLKIMHNATREAVNHSASEVHSFRKVDGRERCTNPPSIEFFPFKPSARPYGETTLSGLVKKVAKRLHLPPPMLDKDYWDRLDDWQIEFADNHLGFPDQRGGTPKWKPGFDRLRWLVDGLSFQQEASVRSPDARLHCIAAGVALSKDEWDTFMNAYSGRSLG